jgi:hypothetical protein
MENLLGHPPISPSNGSSPRNSVMKVKDISSHSNLFATSLAADLGRHDSMSGRKERSEVI